MKMVMRGTTLLMVQCALVLLTAGKYFWERHERPAVWTRVQLFNERELQFIARNPQNRYMEAQLLADACSLPPRAPDMESDFSEPISKIGEPQTYPRYPVRKDVIRPAVRDGKLIVVEAPGVRKSDTQQLILDLRKPCIEARLPEIVRFYVPSSEAMPTKLKPGQTVWALVTVPEQGPPRPIELAISDATGWHPLDHK